MLKAIVIAEKLPPVFNATNALSVSLPLAIDQSLSLILFEIILALVIIISLI